jgi:hypothetical protein
MSCRDFIVWLIFMTHSSQKTTLCWLRIQPGIWSDILVCYVRHLCLIFIFPGLEDLESGEFFYEIVAFIFIGIERSGTRLGFFCGSDNVKGHPWMASYFSNWGPFTCVIREESCYQILEFRRQRIAFIHRLEVGCDVSWNNLWVVIVVLVGTKEGLRSLNQTK